MTEEKLGQMFGLADMDEFKAEIARWQPPALIRIFRRLNKKAGELKRGEIPGGQEGFDFCVNKMAEVALWMDTHFQIRAGVGPDGRSYFQDTQTGQAIALDGSRIGNN